MNGTEIEHLAGDHLPVLTHEEQIQSFKQLKNPPHGRRLRLFAHLIGDRLAHGRQCDLDLMPTWVVSRRRLW